VTTIALTHLEVCWLSSWVSCRQVAAKLFVSAKTVETNLGQVYRKLGIHSQAELGRLMSQ
jgi:DNA-binding CsgD family transcriptional regulator